MQPATNLELVFQFRLAFFFSHGVLPLLGKYPVVDCFNHLYSQKNGFIVYLYFQGDEISIEPRYRESWTRMGGRFRGIKNGN